MLLLWTSLGLAATEGGLQARLFSGALDVVHDQLAGQTFTYETEEVGAEYDCWDYIGVRDLNLSVPIDDLSVGLDDGALSVWVQLGLVSGEDWELYATDEEYLDSCPEFDTHVNSVALRDGVLTALIVPNVEDGALVFSTNGTLDLLGEVETDIDDFPDELAMTFFEQTVLDVLAEQGAQAIETTLSGLIDQGLLSGSAGDYSLSFTPADVRVDTDGLTLEADGAVSWTGEDGCEPTERPPNTGRTPTLNLDLSPGSDLVVGVTEAMVAELIGGLWADGWFCFSEQDLADFVASVQDSFDPDVGGLAATAWLAEPPEVTLSPDGLRLSSRGLGVEVTGEDGASLLQASVDLSGTLELGVDATVGAFTLSVHDLALEVNTLEADHLASGAESSEELSGFLERWALGWLEDQAQDLVLFTTLARGYGMVVRVDELALQEGGLAVALSLFDEDDAEVDDVAPDTSAEVAVDGATATASWGAVDDRAGDLAWSWRLDGGPWSSWTEDLGTPLGALDPGEHALEVAARDAWWNIDASPATATFVVDEEEAGPTPEKERTCGCAADADAARGAGAGVIAAILACFVRSRRLSAICFRTASDRIRKW